MVPIELPNEEHFEKLMWELETTEPNEERFEKWMRDLETTKESQVRGGFHLLPNPAFNVEEGWCALGRLIAVAIDDGVPVQRSGAAQEYKEFESFNHSTGMVLPGPVLAWLGVHNGQHPLLRYAVTLNDYRGAPFRTIAEELREKLRRLKEENKRWQEAELMGLRDDTQNGDD